MTDGDGAAAADRSIDPEDLSGDLGLARTIEALLFVADRALTVPELSEITEAPGRDVAVALDRLQRDYGGRGIVLLEHRDSYRFVSAPEATVFCRRLLGLDARSRLSHAALETLGVVAYRQPVTRAQIDEIRGVDSDSSIATLLGRGLIHETGRLRAPGRPAQFGTTDLFRAYFGIPSLASPPEVEFPPPEPADHSVDPG